MDRSIVTDDLAEWLISFHLRFDVHLKTQAWSLLEIQP